jgi:hypothetical protein
MGCKGSRVQISALRPIKTTAYEPCKNTKNLRGTVRGTGLQGPNFPGNPAAAENPVGLSPEAEFGRSVLAASDPTAFDADGGVDLVLTKGRESTLVQCKQWYARSRVDQLQPRISRATFSQPRQSCGPGSALQPVHSRSAYVSRRHRQSSWRRTASRP